MEKVDMHLHTTWSDGSDTPEELLARLRAKDIKVFSVTDHDTIGGSLYMEHIRPMDMEFYRGVEFSCRTGDVKCHILGYDYDPSSAVLHELLREGEELRRQKLEKRLEHLERVHNIVFPPERIELLRGISSVGKPHLANEIIRLGRASSIDEAIQRYLKGTGTGDTRVDALKAISAIRSAGGIAVWAHPLGGEGERHLSRDAFYDNIQVLLDGGIQGLECWYSRYDLEEVTSLRSAAEQLGLLVSGGSDCHGNGKTIAAGELNSFGRTVYSGELSLLGELRSRQMLRNTEIKFVQNS